MADIAKLRREVIGSWRRDGYVESTQEHARELRKACEEGQRLRYRAAELRGAAIAKAKGEGNG